MYETMVYWETAGDGSGIERDFAGIWRSADKVVYSSTLEEITSARTRIERVFDPAAARAMKEASDRDLAIGGPHLAAQAILAGVVDELQLFVTPVLVGAGNRAVPDARIDLRLLDERRFRNGTVFLRYEIVHS